MNKPLIVFIEDNPGDIELLRMALEQQNAPYELIALADGAEALRFVSEFHSATREPQPCVILLDVHLPKYDGLEVLAALRRQERLRNVHVVMLASGGVRNSEQIRIQHLDAQFRQKPRTFREVEQLAIDVLDLCKRTMLAA